MARSPRQGPIRTDYCEWYLNPNSDSDLDSSNSTESLGSRGDNTTPLIPLSFFSVDPLHILGILFSGQCSSRSLFCSLLLPGFLANLSCSRGGPIHDGEGHTILSAFASPSPVPTNEKGNRLVLCLFWYLPSGIRYVASGWLVNHLPVPGSLPCDTELNARCHLACGLKCQ